MHARSALRVCAVQVSEEGDGMRRLTRRGVVLVVAGVVTAAAFAGTVLANPGGLFRGSDNAWPYNASDSSVPASNPVLVAVGDIACEPDNDENSGNPAAVKCGGSGIGGPSAEFAT